MTNILKNPYWLIVGLIIIVHFAVSWNVSLRESAVMDELAHIPAGYSYIKYFDYRLNPEHPPLMKALAAAPLLFGNLRFPADSTAWTNDVNGQWTMGTQFLYGSGNDADWIIKWSRLLPILITLLLIFYIYLWSSELLGKRWALLPTLLFAFSPAVLAHGHYVATDVGAAFGVFVATYYLFKYLLHPSRNRLIAAGIAFGAAELIKFSTVLLIPFFVAIVALLWLQGIRRERNWLQIFVKLCRDLGHLLLIFFIGYILVYAVYSAFTWNYPVERQVSDTEFILTSFAGGAPKPGETCKLLRCVAELDIWMAGKTLFRPLAQYVLGILMVLQRSAGGNTAYFLGEVSAAGWWYYFPIVYALKEPLPVLVLIAIAFIYGSFRISRAILQRKTRFFDYLGVNTAEFSMMIFAAGYWLYSVKSPLNIGVRHILPTLPFIYILTASAIKNSFAGAFQIAGNEFISRIKSLLVQLFKISLQSLLLILLVLWFIGEISSAYPYYLSYFNEFGGGTFNGYRYVTDSNYDWGQDLKRLAEWTDKNKVNKIAVDYFGGGNPKYYLSNKVEYWRSAHGNPSNQNIHYLAVSVNTLELAFGKLHPGQKRNPEDEYSWLKDIKHLPSGSGSVPEPDYRAGTSIFIYKLQ